MSKHVKQMLITLWFQLIAAGVLDKADYPDFEEETGILPKEDDSGKWLFKGFPSKLAYFPSYSLESRK